MTLNLTPEEKEARRIAYKKQYSKLYYQEQRDENTERYQDIKEKARLRYEKKKMEQLKNGEETPSGKPVRPYKKRNFFNAPAEIINNEQAENLENIL
jgi:NAD+--asparagine ADP-ribosyltransferase